MLRLALSWCDTCVVPRRRDATVADCDNEEKCKCDDERSFEVFVLGGIESALCSFVSLVPYIGA
jgi:hypothetical protein